MEEKKENRGGRRANSGRKKGGEVKKILLNLDVDLFNTLMDVPNKTQFINNAVRFSLVNRLTFNEFVKTLKEQE